MHVKFQYAKASCGFSDNKSMFKLKPGAKTKS